jgi:TPR repeat protein
MLDRGAGGPKDAERALSLYESGCAKDDPTACNNLGVAFHNGQGRPKNPGKASELYQRACNRAYPVACANLGKLFRDGQGVPEDTKRAEELFSKGCRSDTELGRTRACVLLAELVVGNRSSALSLADAKRHLESGCAESLGEGCLALGKYSLERDANVDDARRHFQKACELGVQRGCQAVVVIDKIRNRDGGSLDDAFLGVSPGP